MQVVFFCQVLFNSHYNELNFTCLLYEGQLGSVKVTSGPPDSLQSRESQEPGSSYLTPADKERVEER